jgi:hypothetical protein
VSGCIAASLLASVMRRAFDYCIAAF